MIDMVVHRHNLRETIGSLVGILTKSPVREELSETAPSRLATPITANAGDDLIGVPAEAAHAE
ncbi:MAG: acetyl-CoA carboxylase carboxyl transferase subunit beta [Devosia sp.]|nr:acetyl-CoA carboxylase carboxyl transferase subunit beta [Devosia sp.]